MKKIMTIIAVVLSVILIAALIPEASLSSSSSMFLLGKRFSQSDNTYSDDLPAAVAAYNGHMITEEEVDYQLYADSLRSEDCKLHYSRRDVIDNLLLGYIILDEAREAGLSAEKEEVLNSLELSKAGIEEVPEAAGQLQDFCAGANMTVNEYWAAQEEQLYGELSRIKYMNAFIDDYMESHPDAESHEAVAAYEQFQQELLQKHRDEIVYYGDYTGEQ